MLASRWISYKGAVEFPPFLEDINCCNTLIILIQTWIRENLAHIDNGSFCVFHLCLVR